MRKALRRILPFILLAFLCAYTDRVNVSFAAVQMNVDLKFSATIYGLGGGLFFLGYALFEIPSNMLAVRYGSRPWLARIMVTWGLLSAAMLFVRTPTQFYVMRFLLGVAEAGFYPGVIYYFASWFPASHRGRAVSRFYVAAPLASGVMGAVSGPLLALDGVAGLRGWQWLFLVQGLPSVVVGLVVLRFLPDRPDRVAWLTPEERAWIGGELSREAALIGEPRNHNPLAALRSPTVLLLSATGLLYIGVTNTMALSAPLLLLARTGLDTRHVGYLVSGGGVIGALVMLAMGEYADRRGDRFLNAFWLTVVMAGALLALAAAPSPPGVIVAYLAFVAVCFAVAMLVSSGWAEALHVRELAVGAAAINSVCQLGAFAMPFGWGALRDATGGFTAGLGALLACTLASAALTLNVRAVVRGRRAVAAVAPAVPCLVLLLVGLAATAAGAQPSRPARARPAAPAPVTERQYLSGTGSDRTVPWEFRVSGGRRAGRWDSIPVPSNWEMQGFGTYRYHDDWSASPAPDSIGEYRHHFRAPAAWRGRRVTLVVGASMTDTEVQLNGRRAGPTHRGGFTEFRYDVTDLLRLGEENRLEVRVRKFSTDSSVNRAERQSDFWLFGGIFRPVWLEAAPAEHIAHVAVDARHTGAFAAVVDLAGVVAADRVTARIERLDGTAVGAPFAAPVPPGLRDTGRVALRARVPGVRPWSAEWPQRYRVRLRLSARGAVVHEVVETFGFRTVEVRPHDGLYVNGAKVRLRGSNRHSIWPTTGRATSAALSAADVRLMKDMNMNAVRMSHYPPDRHFLDACDSLGLFVLDELPGWQQPYGTEAGRPLVRELVERDVNHPSVILWDNGNEGGWNRALDGDFARYDPQRRTVLHPWENFNGVNTSHYEVADCCAGSFFGGDDLILPTEFLHALYDGGGGAGLADWWERLVAHPLGVGGFLWAFADEGVVRADQGGRVDVAGNRAPDGVVGPYREKEGSFLAIRKIWSPVYLPWGGQDRLPPSFDGALRVENRYDATDLGAVRFAWRLLDFPPPGAAGAGHTVGGAGTVRSPRVPPRGVGTLRLDLPPDWRRHDALALTATDPHGRELYTWTWMIPTPDAVAARVVGGAGDAPPAAGELLGGVVTMRGGGTEVRIDATTGRLAALGRGGRTVGLRDGPRPVAGTAALTRLAHRADGRDYVVEAEYSGALQRVTWRLTPAGWLRLDYAYREPADAAREYLGVTFDYPEGQVTGLRWLGRGPYRVWKNRLAGAEFDVWEKAYNDAMTGLSWEYPEFKGFHANVHWATLEAREAPLTVVVASPGVFLRVLTPREPTGPDADPRTTHVAFPPGDLSFLHGIAPIGTKFHAAAEHGPAGGPNLVRRHGATFTATVWLRVDDPPAPARR